MISTRTRGRPPGGRLAWLKFFPEDWIKDTRALSPAAKGAWIDILCYAFLNGADRGRVTGSLASWRKCLGCASTREVRRLLTEIQRAKVAEVRFCNSLVTVISRRMLREERERRSQRKRTARSRAGTSAAGAGCNAPVPELSPTEARGQEARGQKPEARTGAPGDGSGSSCAGRSPNHNGPSHAEMRALEAAGEAAGCAPLPEAVLVASAYVGIPTVEAGKLLADGHDPRRLVAWLLVTKKREPHDPARGGALAYFRSLCKKGAEPPDWALAGAKLLESAKKIQSAERRQLFAQFGSRLDGLFANERGA